jgi:hypothetical protein
LGAGVVAFFTGAVGLGSDLGLVSDDLGLDWAVFLVSVLMVARVADAFEGSQPLLLWTAASFPDTLDLICPDALGLACPDALDTFFDALMSLAAIQPNQFAIENKSALMIGT